VRASLQNKPKWRSLRGWRPIKKAGGPLTTHDSEQASDLQRPNAMQRVTENSARAGRCAKQGGVNGGLGGGPSAKEPSCPTCPSDLDWEGNYGCEAPTSVLNSSSENSRWGQMPSGRKKRFGTLAAEERGGNEQSEWKRWHRHEKPAVTDWNGPPIPDNALKKTAGANGCRGPQPAKRIAAIKNR